MTRRGAGRRRRIWSHAACAVAVTATLAAVQYAVPAGPLGAAPLPRAAAAVRPEPAAGPARCRWYDAAIDLARSIAGVTDPRAADLRAELARLGITADSTPPPECDDRDDGDETEGDGDEPTGPPPGAEPLGPPGRIALSADGNQHDEDDWASSAMTLAILAHDDLQPNVVHYAYDDHIWDSDAEYRENMRESVLGAGERFGFDTTRFFDAADPKELDDGVANLTAEIDASTADDELWIVLAGPMEVAWMALDAADPEARQHVKCLSHGEWNETHGRDDHGGHDYDDLIDLGCQRVQIPDQNSNLGETDMSDWDYLNDLGDDMQWLYDRIGLHGDGDVSDAGMVLYLLTGEEEFSRSELRDYLTSSPAPLTDLPARPEGNRKGATGG